MSQNCNPRIGIGAVVVEDEKILLVKRGHPPGEGQWSIPGGHLKPGELVAEAALRELEEETGLTGDPVGVVNIEELIIEDTVSGEPCYHYIILDVLIENPRGNPRAGGDATDVAWFPIAWAAGADNVTRSTREFLSRLIRGEVSPEKPYPTGITRYTCK